MVGRETEKVERRMVGQGYVGLGDGLLYVVRVGRLEGCHASLTPSPWFLLPFRPILFPSGSPRGKPLLG